MVKHALNAYRDLCMVMKMVLFFSFGFLMAIVAWYFF